MDESQTWDNSVTGCPPPSVLQSVADGQAPAEETAAHIASCIRCQNVLDTCFGDEDLLAELAAAVEVTEVETGSRGTGPPKRLGEYEIQSELHRGGQGVVYSAFHPPTKRTVALKVMLQGAFASSKQRARFEREVELIASLRHPGIVTLYDGGTTPDGMQYLAMEFVDGVRLDEYRDVLSDANGGKPPIRETMRLVEEICDAVAFAQRRGIIHRDLKPANILVSPDGRPHILDFGIAKLDADTREPDSEVTVEGEFVGTFSYAAPEQVDQTMEAVDIRTDVYALGIILYEMITGERPRRLKGSMADFIRAITQEEPVPPSTHRADIHGEVENIILKAMARDPDRRYQSALALRNDIANYLAGRPIDAQSDSALYVLRKSAWRYRVPLSIAAVFVVLLLGVAAFAIQARLNDAERRIKEAESGQQLEFIKDIFGSTDWRLSGQYVATVPEFLDVTARELRAHLTDHPDIYAAILFEVGRAYLGESTEEARSKAYEATLRSLEIRESILASPHDDLADNHFQLGRILWNQEEYDQAERHYRTALNMRLQLHDDDNDLVADAYHHLAATLSRMHRDDEWPDLYTRAIRMKVLVYGESSIPVAIVRNSRAVSYRDAQRYREAIEEFEGVLRILLQTSDDPTTDPRIVIVHNNIATAAIALHTDDGNRLAITHLDEAVAIQRRRFGARSQQATPFLTQLARLHLREADSRQGSERQRHITMGAAHAAEAVALLRVAHPNGHEDLAAALTVVGRAFLAAERRDTARMHLQDAVDMWDVLVETEVLAELPMAALEARSALGLCRAMSGETGPETERLLHASLEALRSDHNDDHPIVRDACRRWQRYLVLTGRSPDETDCISGDDGEAEPSRQLP